jgi:multiple RNA-binding domain-containing protein 1
MAGAEISEANDVTVVADAPSDDEYETVPKKAKRSKQDEIPAESTPEEHPADLVQQPLDLSANDDTTPDHAAPDPTTVSDADWARSRTSRLLGLLDDDEEDLAMAKPDHDSDEADDDDVPAREPPAKPQDQAPIHETSIPTPPADETEAQDSTGDTEIDAVRASMRLFVRNLPYNVQKEDLQAEFAPYGNLEEVSYYLSLSTTFCYRMNPDRDNLCYGI